MTNSFGLYTVCLYVLSKELVAFKKELNFEVCGSETATLSDTSDVDLSYTITASTSTPT